MLADRRSATFLALALSGLGGRCLTQSTPCTCSFAVVLAYLRSTTLLALALDTVVVADAGAPA
jgi:hypothetical protein